MRSGECNRGGILYCNNTLMFTISIRLMTMVCPMYAYCMASCCKVANSYPIVFFQRRKIINFSVVTIDEYCYLFSFIKCTTKTYPYRSIIITMTSRLNNLGFNNMRSGASQRKCNFLTIQTLLLCISIDTENYGFPIFYIPLKL